MALKALLQSVFGGLWATDNRSGPTGSYAYSRAFDGRTKPSQLSVQPALVRRDSGIMDGLPQAAVMDISGTIWLLSGNTAAGQLVKRTTAGAYSEVGTMSSATFGLDYRHDTDSLYLTGTKSVSRLQSVSAGGNLLPDAYGDSFSTYNNAVAADALGVTLAAFQDTGTASYTLPSAIIESQPNTRYFQVDITPLDKINAFVLTTGSGDITLTLHDGENTTLGSAIITNANLVANDWNNFVFASQVMIYPAPNARTYHWHITSSNGTGTVEVAVAADLSTANTRIFADRLIATKNGFHPMVRFQQFEIIGNGPYLSAWEPISDVPTNDEWRRQAITLPSEYECCGLALSNEFVVAAFEKVSSGSTTTPQSGLLVFWDGLSSTYNYTMIIPEGSPQGLNSWKNTLYYEAGGSWWAVSSPVSLPVKLRAFPNQNTDFSGDGNPILVYPSSATVRRGVNYIGWPGSTTNTGLEYGVYGWGAISKNWPDGFSLDFSLSTGALNYSVANNLKISLVQSFGDLMLVGWQDDVNGAYGVDEVNSSSLPAVVAVYQSMVFDNNFAQKPKQANYVDCYYYAVAGSTITLAYALDGGTWVTDTNSYSLTNKWSGQANYCRFSVANDARFHELQVQVTVTHDGSSATPTVIQSVGRVFQDLREESLDSSG